MTRVALLATGRSTFVEAAGRSVHRRALALLQELGADVTSPDHLVEYADGVGKSRFTAADADLDILLCATFADASVALAAFGSSPRPVLLWAVRDPAPAGERLYLNSLCGANLAAHALVRAGVEVRLVYGDPEEPAVRQALSAALEGDTGEPPVHDGRPLGDLAPEAEVRQALASLEGAVIGVSGDVPVGFTTCEYEPDWLRDRFGLEVEAVPLESTFERIAAVPEAERRRVVAAAEEVSPTLAGLPAAEVDRFGAVAVALGAWSEERRLAAVALRCWPEFPVQLGVCPCSALGILAGRGVATACEADVNGAATMLLMRALDPAHGLTYLADVVALDDRANTATFWHCGLAPVELAADPGSARQDLHCNRGIGVAGNFPLRPGRVTVARVSWSGDRHRLLLMGGDALVRPNRYKGNSLEVRLDGDAGRFVRTVIEHGFEHHTVLAWAELRPQLRRAAQVLGLELFEC